MSMTRRAALGASAALPAAALLPRPAVADGHAGPPPRFRSFGLGDMEVTVLLAGSAVREGDMQETFAMNVDAETFQAASDAAFIPTDQVVFYFQPTILRTGGDVVLFDTGLNPAGITGVLEAAGFAPGDVTKLVITHMHGDHVGGLSEGGTPIFANAQHYTGEAEMAAWQASPNDTFTDKVAPLADAFELIAPGAEIAPGVTAVDMFGHTPGHMGYRLSSGDAQAMLAADMTNHYVWSLAHPDWEVRFDMDKAAAAATRRRVLDEVSTDRIPMIGYHMPHPAVGYVETAGDGFRWVPESYQLSL